VESENIVISGKQPGNIRGVIEHSAEAISITEWVTSTDVQLLSSFDIYYEVEEGR